MAPMDELLEWSAQITPEALPSDVQAILRNDLLDALGCGLFGSTLPDLAPLRRTLGSDGPRAARSGVVWGTSLAANPADAAALNAAAVNSFGLDAGNQLVLFAHGSATVYPAIMAIADLTQEVSGADVLCAAAAGWEVLVRTSQALGGAPARRGFYGTPMFGTVGSAVAAARALHLSTEQMRGAVELALLLASGLKVSAKTTASKTMGTGIAVRNGVTCALMAREGARGPRHAYDADMGFAEAFGSADERDDSFLTAPFQSNAARNVSFKLYPTVAGAQSVVELIADYQQADADLRPINVKRIDIRMSPQSVRAFGGPYVPGDATTAQRNLRYCVAAQLLEGSNSVDQFRPDLLRDAAILDLVDRIHVDSDETLGQTSLTRRQADVSIELADGTALSERRENKRSAGVLELDRKFRGLAGRAITQDALESLVRDVARLERLTNASSLSTALVPHTVEH